MKRTQPKEQVVEMIEGAIDSCIEELLEYCEKHHLNYAVDIHVWKWGEAPPELPNFLARASRRSGE